MKAIYFAILALSTCLFCSSCDNVDATSQVNEGLNDGQSYVNDALGWQIDVPTTWTIVSKNHSEALQESGQQAIADATGVDVDVSQLQNLIGFKKGQVQLFPIYLGAFRGRVRGALVEEQRRSSRAVVRYLSQTGNELRSDQR